VAAISIPGALGYVVAGWDGSAAVLRWIHLARIDGVVLAVLVDAGAEAGEAERPRHRWRSVPS
jgi:hypothetical protein